MADGYMFPVSVDLEGATAPRLKLKLMKYFQSRKSSGGECEVDYEPGSSTAMVRFRREEDQRSVLQRRSHQIQLDSGMVKMSVSLPTDRKSSQEEASKEDIKEVSLEAEPAALKKSEIEYFPLEKNQPETEGAKAESEDEDPYMDAMVLGNLPDSMDLEVLEMLVENIFDGDSSSPKFTLELLPDISSAVVIFQRGTGKIDLNKCNQNRVFINRKLTAQRLGPTNQIVAEDVERFGEDILHLYFENNCGDVESVIINKEDQSAIVTFKEDKAVKRVMKMKHHIKKEEIRVYPFYKSLGRALYGNEKQPSPKLPSPISESIDVALWKFISVSEPAAKSVQSELAKHHCNVNLSQSIVQLSPSPSLLQQKDAKVLIREWTTAVKSTFAQAVSKFRQLVLRPDEEVWDECDLKIKNLQQQENIIIHPDKLRGHLTVVGYRNDIDRLESTLCGIVDKVIERVRREKLIVSQEIKVSSSVFYILCQDGLQEKLKQVYPALVLSYHKDHAVLKVTGLSDEILAANRVIYDAMLSLKRQNLELDSFVIDLIKSEQQEEVTETLLISAGINAVLDIGTNRVQLMAVSGRDLNAAQCHLVQLLTSQYVDVEDSNVLKKTEWQQLVFRLESENSKPCRRTQIRIKDNQVVVSGHIDNVYDVSEELEDFLTQNAQTEETVMVKPCVKLNYIKTMHTSWMKPLQDTVVLTFRKDAVCVSGSRVHATEAKKVIEKLVCCVFFEILNISKPGVKKLFQEKEAMYVSILKSETNCLVELVNDTQTSQDDSKFQQGPKPLYQLQTPDGVDIVVCKADLCTYPIDAVVSSSSPDLKHKGGLAGALSKAAGPQLQDECDKIIQTQGQLKPGDSVITNAGGRLCCKRVIHAVAPTFEPAKPAKALAQLKRAVKGSLELAEADGCVSVALPAISKGLGFPLPLCAITIVKAVKEHCDEKCDDGTLRRIDFVNNDDATVQAIKSVIRQEFGNYGVSPSHEDHSSHGKPAGFDQDLYHGQTKEGVNITLAKGCIENATTDVIVNILASDLSLNKGAVSNAILHVAGSKLQDLVKASKSSGHVGEIIVTDACKLRCKQVYHAIAPHYNKGNSKSEKELRKIISDCLNRVENDALTSITFPAIGTGNLGFPRDQAVTLMYEEILAFSSKAKPQHLKTITIILFAGDVETVQVFCQEFKKMVPTSSDGSGSSPSSGYFSQVVSSPGMYETKMGSVTIQVAKGDITKETTDVIVNSSNDTFTLKSGVSKAILEAAGQAVEAECQKLGADKTTGMMMTQGGNLSCKKILHLVGQTDPQKINNAVKDALQMCLSNSFTSVSFPALGTGQGQVKAKQVADVMLDAVISVLSKNTSGTLTTLRIVIFQEPMLNDFYSSMQERQVTDTKDKGFWQNFHSKVKAFFYGKSLEKHQRNGDFVVAPVQTDPACFHICSDSQTNIDRAKQWINHMVAQELHNLAIKDDAILHFSDSDYKLINEIQRKLSVSITTESKQAVASVIIEGLNKDVLLASNEIYKMLGGVREQEETKRKVEVACTVADWQYKEQGATFQSFEPMNNFLLEQALEKNQVSIKVTVLSQDYTVDMQNNQATDSQGNTMEIRRIDKLKDEEMPGHWEPMKDNTKSHSVTLNPGTAEHTEILSLFQATCTRPVTKIERIQNPVLWKSLMIKKRHMEEMNGHQNNERRLFHGTCQTTVATINEHGFNRSFAGKNAANYGNGSYFAVNANYSAQDTYSKPNATGDKFMYVCRVLTGDFTLGKVNMLVPPSKGAQSVQMYDSVVDNMTTPHMFIIFHDSHAYPEYLISFK
ncbi:poly(ADP-ribose) polymerase family member 14-related sequence 1 isoform X2 [Gouania willdenowi]|uniref:poly(ADP-ribose) polymerase family member 14-related sequence 1 isoform X2 n=1 Tax=Gouania willdenowi TaxID=441366 RepID=UPI001056285D|nr:protein mono-ADP-ribosyltransferase PARP14-like isoform X2 [Gouania willdenowi]